MDMYFGKIHTEQPIIFHHNDADGRCAAFIMAHYFFITHGHKARFVEVDYASKIDVETIKPGTIVAVVDFSFKPEIMAQVERRAKPVIWCDHHKTAEHYGYNHLPGIRDFKDKGLCGAECVWEFCFPKDQKPLALEILGDYDAWRHSFGQATFDFYEGLKLENTSPNQQEDSIWPFILFSEDRGTITREIQHHGAVAIKYRDNYCRRIAAQYGYETQLGEFPAFAMNAYSFGNQGFPYEIRAKYPILIAYIYDGREYTVSLYSAQVDVSEIAKFYGGGGHKGAAGFTCTTLPFVRRKE